MATMIYDPEFESDLIAVRDAIGARRRNFADAKMMSVRWWIRGSLGF